MRFLAPAFLVALTLFGCSGSSSDQGGRTTTGGATSVRFVVDTGADSPAEVGGLLATVAFERAGGGFTRNLLTDNPRLVLADPLGASSSVRLDQVPPGLYTAVHFAFLPGSLRARYTGGVVRTVTSGSSLRIPLGGAVDVRGPHGWFFVLRHDRPIDLTPGPGGEVEWRSDLKTLVTDMHPLRDERVEVLSVDVSNRTALARFTRWDTTPTTLDFDDAYWLGIDGQKLSVAQFLSAFDPGDEILLVDSVVRSHERVHVLVATDVEPVLPPQAVGRGNKTDVRGVIQRLVPGRPAFDLAVRSVHKAGAGFPSRTHPVITVYVDSTTNLKWIPRAGQQRARLAFGDLRAGMWVDVEWHGPPVLQAVVAHKIEIRATDRGRHRVPVTDRVQSVDLVNRRIVVESTNGSGVALPGGVFPTITMDVAPDTLLLRREAGGLGSLTLSDVRPGDMVDLFARPLTGNTVRGSLLSLRR